MKILEEFWENQIGKSEIIKDHFAPIIVFKSIQFYDQSLLKLTIEFLEKLLWHSNETYDSVMNAMYHLKVEKGHKIKYETILSGLKESKNILAIKIILKYLVVICESQTDERKKANTKTELVHAGMPDILTVLFPF